jgi:hypothetical protein
MSDNPLNTALQTLGNTVDSINTKVEQAKQNVVDDTVFVINQFMDHFNTYMMFEAEKKKLT